MDLTGFSDIIRADSQPVVLLEGMRALPDSDREKLVTVGRFLAEKFPSARFRTGNAAGTDEAFAEGVAFVDATRLEYVLPYPGHRKKQMVQGARVLPLQEVAEEEERLVALTLEASPSHSSMLEKRNVVPKLRAKAKYILRDTLKVTGLPDQGFGRATIGLFYANPDDPLTGGTGHTIRVCRQCNVPAVLQADWLTWMYE